MGCGSLLTCIWAVCGWLPWLLALLALLVPASWHYGGFLLPRLALLSV